MFKEVLRMDDKVHVDLLAERPLWDVHDVARFLKASRSCVYHWAAEGRLPALRVGGFLRFEPEAIRRCVLEQNGGVEHTDAKK